MRTANERLLEQLEKHRRGLKGHLQKASEFLIKCQIAAPYVERGTLHGCVCPWEIKESADEGAFPILEDFHDTLEAIWVWSLYTKVSGDMSFRPSVDWAWKYIIKNWNRFIGKESMKDKGLYDCSYVLFAGTLFASVFGGKCQSRFLLAGNRLAEHLSRLNSTDGREYDDPYWMAYSLELAARKLKQTQWRLAAEAFVKNTLVNRKDSFTRLEEEPDHVGPGGHDFFSKNANMALALISCLDHERITEILLTKFLPCVPANFVARKADENAWNAHVATALGKSYVLTRKEEFLRRYFAIMNELARRDDRASAALPRSPSFGRRESWVTFFYAHAYASVIENLID